MCNTPRQRHAAFAELAKRRLDVVALKRSIEESADSILLTFRGELPAGSIHRVHVSTASSRESRRDTISVSLQTVATKTGLSKSTVQSAIRHLRPPPAN